MSQAEMKQRMADTEAEVLRWMGEGWTAERLFWLRVELGQDYIRDRYPKPLRKPVQDSQAFWHWWRQVWHINDRRWLSHLETGRLPEEAVPYEYWHDVESCKYFIGAKHLGVAATPEPITV